MLNCPKCGETFLSKKSYDSHAQKHLQTHIDTWSDEKGTKDISDMPQGLNRELFKTFEKYDIGSSCILCLWKNGQLNVAMRSVARQHELIDRVKEWIVS
jgi:hypothetical protein